ncbi:MAG: tRNA (adenosine(37)-N6)-dimethylallyltransferase MiaA [Candidatus Desulfofervidaceae bacterium]|nr:tRNA (adenosine(37)-N6)-dimethylallyltransferase MiaA [Candidatus Desulfofervidaceae bacterium]
MKNKPKIIILTGPTGVGKTNLSLSLAQKFNAEIVNADSMQIYRYLDIGTAKPTPAERAIIPHHLIDIRNPDEDYDAAQFRDDADRVIKNIISQGKHPLIVGGTMLYLKVLTQGIFPSPPVDETLRQRLKQLAEEKGREWLHQYLTQIDPEAAHKIHPTDIVRLIRAIEVYELTGKPISWHQRQHGFQESPYDYLKICLHLPRETLYKRINQRVEFMFKQGLVTEVENLLKMGYTPDLKPLQAIGYRHVIAYLKGKWNIEKAKEVTKRDTRRYAKRQLAWWRQDKEVLWFEPQEKEAIEQIIKQWLNK